MPKVQTSTGKETRPFTFKIHEVIPPRPHTAWRWLEERGPAWHFTQYHCMVTKEILPGTKDTDHTPTRTCCGALWQDCLGCT